MSNFQALFFWTVANETNFPRKNSHRFWWILMMLFRTIHLVFYPLYVIENRALVNDGKSRKKVRDTWPHLCFRKKLQYSILSDRKLGKNAKASTYTNLCVFIRFPDLTPLLAWIANMKSGKKCTCFFNGESSTKIKLTVFWCFEVETAFCQKSSLKFNNVSKRLALGERAYAHRMSQRQMCSTFGLSCKVKCLISNQVTNR